MKKQVLFTILMLVSLAGFSQTFIANVGDVDLLFFITNQAEKTVIIDYPDISWRSGMRPLKGNVTLPTSVTYTKGDKETYRVIGITDGAFSDYPDLTSVTIPDCITEIGSSLFSGSDNVISVVVSDDNPVYDSRDNCNAIIEKETNKLVAGCSVSKIPNSVSSIGNMAFYGCTNLKTIIIPEGVSSIGDEAFCGCTNLSTISIPKSVTYVGGNAFRETAWFNSKEDGVIYFGTILNAYKGNMPENTIITIEEGTKEISGCAFENCTGLASIVFPNSVTKIGYNAFYGCTNLQSVILPNNLNELCSYTFGYCTSLTSIEIPSSIKSIEQGAFYGCTNLQSVILPNNLNELCSYTFGYCTSLTSIEIPSSIKSIEQGAFDGCNNLTMVTINSNNIVSDIESSQSNMSSIFGNHVKTYIIGNEVTGIGDAAFAGCSGLTSIEIPNSVTTIGKYAFSQTALTSIKLPNGLTNIEDGTFGWCGKLTSIEIPNSVTSIGEGAFKYCSSLTSVTIPNCVTSIGNSAFLGCI